MAWTTPDTFNAGNVLTAAELNKNVRDNTNALYDSVRLVGSLSRTTQLIINAGVTSEVFASDLTINTVNGVAYRCEFFCANAVTGAGGYLQLILTNGSGTGLGRMSTIGGSATEFSVYAVHYFTATAASTTFNIEGTSSVTNNILRAGDGTGTNLVPMFLRVFGPDLS